MKSLEMDLENLNGIKSVCESTKAQNEKAGINIFDCHHPSPNTVDGARLFKDFSSEDELEAKIASKIKAFSELELEAMLVAV